MGKAARLNRERREKAMRDDPDWGTPEATVLIMLSAFRSLESFLISEGFSSVEAYADRVKSILLYLVARLMREHPELGSIRLAGIAPNKTAVHILSDDDDFWFALADSEEGLVVFAIHDNEYLGFMPKGMLSLDGLAKQPPQTRIASLDRLMDVFSGIPISFHFCEEFYMPEPLEISLADEGILIGIKNETDPKATILTGKEREEYCKILSELERLQS